MTPSDCLYLSLMSLSHSRSGWTTSQSTQTFLRHIEMHKPPCESFYLSTTTKNHFGLYLNHPNKRLPPINRPSRTGIEQGLSTNGRVIFLGQWLKCKANYFFFAKIICILPSLHSCKGFFQQFLENLVFFLNQAFLEKIYCFFSLGKCNFMIKPQLSKKKSRPAYIPA